LERWEGRVREIPLTLGEYLKAGEAPKLRRITIKTPSSQRYDYTMVFDSGDPLEGGMSDSYALNTILSQVDPGKEYVVVFTDVTFEDKTWTTLLEIIWVDHA
jgi:hypothetical protein